MNFPNFRKLELKRVQVNNKLWCKIGRKKIKGVKGRNKTIMNIHQTPQKDMD